MLDLEWANPNDVEAILDLMEEYHRQEGLRGHARSRLKGVLEMLFEQRNRGRVAVARDAGELLGYALVVRRPSFEWASDLAVRRVRGFARNHATGRQPVRSGHGLLSRGRLLEGGSRDLRASRDGTALRRGPSLPGPVH